MGSYVAPTAYAQYRLIKKIAAAGLQAYHEPLSPLEEDTLGPFTTLTTEDQWSKKAEHRPPGTYYVVTNTLSFLNVEEYCTKRVEAVSRSSTQDGDDEGHGRSFNTNVSIGTDTLILGTFEDGPQRTVWTLNPATVKQSLSTITPPNSPRLTSFTKGQGELQVSPTLIQCDAQRQAISLGFSERRLSSQHRSFVRRHILQTNRDPAISSTQVTDAIEKEATSFEPVC